MTEIHPVWSGIAMALAALAFLAARFGPDDFFYLGKGLTQICAVVVFIVMFGVLVAGVA